MYDIKVDPWQYKYESNNHTLSIIAIQVSVSVTHVAGADFLTVRDKLHINVFYYTLTYQLKFNHGERESIR